MFEPKKDAKLEIPCDTLDDMEYGQKAGRRIVTAILGTPLALFAKHRSSSSKSCST